MKSGTKHIALAHMYMHDLTPPLKEAVWSSKFVNFRESHITGCATVFEKPIMSNEPERFT